MTSATPQDCRKVAYPVSADHRNVKLQKGTNMLQKGLGFDIWKEVLREALHLNQALSHDGGYMTPLS